MRFDDQTVFVTGAGSGIGREAVSRFASDGATVIVADIDGEAASETADTIRSDGGTAVDYELDVRDADAVRDAIDVTADEYGLDVVVNNAGISHERDPVDELDLETRDRVVDVNVNGVWNGCRAAIPHFRDQESGAIVNTASLAGVIGSPGSGAYSLSKGAVVNFTRTVAAEVGRHGVRANAVCPGYVETPLVTGGRDEDEWDDVRERMTKQYPLGRIGRPEDIAGAIAFLASDDAAWITGQALVVDGGFSCA